MNLMSHVMAVAFGSAKAKTGELVTVCSVDGCMAEQLNPVYRGKVVGKTKVKCYGAPNGTTGAIEIKVTDPMKTGGKAAEIKTELTANLRRLECGSLVVLT